MDLLDNALNNKAKKGSMLYQQCIRNKFAKLVDRTLPSLI